jgi:hypothetical protein
MAEELMKLKRGSRKMQYVIEQYKATHPDEGNDISPYLVSEWAVDNHIWKPAPVSPKEQLRRLLSRSLRETYLLDPQGREVRANLPIVEEIMTADGPQRRSRWYPIFDAPAQVARASFSLRRRLALADVAQLKFDFMSWNDNNRVGESLEPLDFDFNKDLSEMEQPTTYPEGPEFDEEDEDEDDDL